MRQVQTLVGLLVFAGTACGQDIIAPKRYEIEENLAKYPQISPQQAMQSVSKLIIQGRIDYLLAHLVDPTFVDGKVETYMKLYKGPEKSVKLVAFHQLVTEVKSHFVKDPALVEELHRYAKEGVWEVDGAKGKANARLPDVTSRRVYFIKDKERWYLQNSQVEL
jgi:hypothetical protein